MANGKKRYFVLILTQFYEHFHSEMPRYWKLGHSAEMQVMMF